MALHENASLPFREGSLVLVNGQRYQVARNLNLAGDNPDFHSWKLQLLVADNQPTSVTRELVLKLPSLTVPPRHGSKDWLRRLEKRHGELIRLDGIPSVPRFFRLSVVSLPRSEGEPAPLPEAFVREFVHGMLLSEWIDSDKTLIEGSKLPFKGISKTSDWFLLARKLIEALVPIHDERLVHGDLRPRSIMLEGTKDDIERFDLQRLTIRLLDVEEDCPRAFPADGIAVTGTFRRKYDSPQRLFEKRTAGSKFIIKSSNAHWFAPTDIFSLGMILYELACGSEAEFGPFSKETRHKYPGGPGHGPVWFKLEQYQLLKTNRQLKDALQGNWPKRVPDSSTPSEDPAREELERILRISEVILACLRSHTDASVADLKGILSILDEFEPTIEPLAPADTPSIAGVTTSIEGLQQLRAGIDLFVERDAAGLPSSIRTIARRRGDRLFAQLEELARGPGFLRIGGRAAVVDTMVHLLNGLGPESRCQALLTHTFFDQRNIGVYGRVVTALQLATLRGAEIDWVIAIEGGNLQNREIGELLQQQRAAAQFLGDRYRYGVHYAVVDHKEMTDLLRDQLTSIFIMNRRQENDTEPPKVDLLIAPDYHGEFGKIAALRIWPSREGEHAASLDRHKERRAELQRSFATFAHRKLHVSAFHR